MNGPIRAYAILSLIFLSFITLGYAWGERHGLMAAFILCLALHWLLYHYFDQYTVHLFQARPLEGQDPWGLLPSLKKICQRARIPQPQVYLVDCPAMTNAFSIGKQPEKSALLISRPLLEKLTPAEVNAILAWQVAHFNKLDNVAFSLASAFSEVILLPARFFESRYQWRRNPLLNGPPWLVKRFFLNHILLNLFGPIAWAFRRLLVSPQNYYAADEMAASLTESPKTLAQALWKMESYAQSHDLDVPASTAHLFIVNPLTANGWCRYFQAQPSVESRIRRLTGEFPV